MTPLAPSSLFLANGEAIPGPSALRAAAPPESSVRFAATRTRDRVSELVVHESVTRSVDATLRILRKRGLGVHLVLGPDGTISQHADLVTDVVSHAGRAHNATSVGVEVVSPYYPRVLKRGLPWGRTIDAPWAHEGRYVLPTPPQADALAELVRWITRGPTTGIAIPRRWPGLRDGFMALGRVEKARTLAPGILAHHYFGHADGAWLVLYTWLRLEAELPPFVAFEEAIRRAEGARRAADVRDLLPTGSVA